jgi:hypothetical protein
LEYTISVNEDKKKEKESFMSEPYHKMIGATLSPRDFKNDLNGSPFRGVKDAQVRPRLLQANFADSLKFKQLSAGFQKVFSDQDREHIMKLPIVGYSGH